MRTIFPKATARAAWVLMILAISSLLWVFAPGQAAAGFCSSTSCSLTLTDSSFIGTGTFGTVNLTLSSNVVTIDVNLASAYRIVQTGFPGAVGFADNLGGGLTMGNFKPNSVLASRYSGYQSLAPGCTTQDCHWDRFGYANNTATIAGLNGLFRSQQLSFTVSKGTSITDVHQLLQQFGQGQRGPAYFVVDACVWDPNKRGCGSTGLFAVTQIPEPASLAMLASGLLMLGFLLWRRVV
jgi:PEP-CTERM motif